MLKDSSSSWVECHDKICLKRYCSSLCGYSLGKKIYSQFRYNDQYANILVVGVTIYCIQIVDHDSLTWWQITWKHFPRYWPFVRGIHRSPVHKGQWYGALMFSLIWDLNKRLSKQSWDWWSETPWSSLWRNCNEVYGVINCKMCSGISFNENVRVCLCLCCNV